MEFSPFNPIVKSCLQGMEMEEKGMAKEARNFFVQAWEAATNDFEKFLAAYYLARQQETIDQELHWLETALQFALNVNDPAVESGFADLYLRVAHCYEELNDAIKAKENYEKAISYQHNPSDKGPFYHGTKANLQIGELLTPGGSSNYQSNLTMHHIYFTALPNGAGLAAALAKGDGEERVYIIEPTGNFENDPNLTNKKFPGNPSRSYRSTAPLKISGEIKNWQRQNPEELQKFRDKLENNKGKIIN